MKKNTKTEATVERYSAMEIGDHFKNGANSKSQMSRNNYFVIGG